MTTHRTSSGRLARFHLLVLVAVAAVLAGCGSRPAQGTRTSWVLGVAEPAFDPDGPPDAVRCSIERWLSRPLLGLDSLARPTAGIADRWEWSADSLTLTFHLPATLRFVDGSRCGSARVLQALQSALASTDHSTAAWALASVRGVDALRPGKPLPPLGLQTPDSTTLVLQLARRDAALPLKLARARLGSPWRDRRATRWQDAVGVGPLAVAYEQPGLRLTLVAARAVLPRGGRADTLALRFLPGEGRVRAALRARIADVVWPVPPGLVREPLPAGFAVRRREPLLPRTLLLVMREDVPPTSRLPARRALAHTLNRSDLLRTLDVSARDIGPWLRGAPPFVFPGYDTEAALDWMARGKLGRSFHVTMAYDADGTGARIARAMQGEWARLGLYVDLLPLHGAEWSQEALHGSRAQLLLLEQEALGEEPALLLAPLVMPVRGPAIGAFRTGWRTREFDPWLRSTRAVAPLAPGPAQQRLEEELVVLPLAALGWEWIERDGFAGTGLDPRPGSLHGEVQRTR